MSRISAISAICGLCAVAVLIQGCPADPEPAAEDTEGSGALTVHDPLSMPAEPTLDPTRFKGAASCAPCHPKHHADWSSSTHAYAMVDPVFRALVTVRQSDLDGTQDQFCTQCHSSIGTRGGECVSGFSFDQLSPITLEGVTCEACHRATELERPYNSGHRIDPDAPIGGPLLDPVPNEFHETERRPFMGESSFCGGCHDVVETSGLNLERPFAEWLESPAAGEVRTCQSCHMPAWDGEAGAGGPARVGLHSHTFIGVGLPLIAGILEGDARKEKSAATQALLESSAALSLSAPADTQAGSVVDLLVTITNQIDGHNLPTGTTFIRQLWLELTATDSEGRVLFRTGHLDDNGDLRDYWSALDPYGDPDLITVGSRLIDAQGEPTLFPWRASEHISTTLPPLHARTYTLFLPVPATVAGPIEVSARLRFRTFPPYLLRALELTNLAHAPTVRDIATAELTIDVP